MTEDHSTSSPLLSCGAKLRDRWEVLKKIGGGGFGEIYKGRDNSTGQVRYNFNTAAVIVFYMSRYVL